MKSKQDRVYLSETNRQLILNEMEGTILTFTQALNKILTKVALAAQGEQHDKNRLR